MRNIYIILLIFSNSSLAAGFNCDIYDELSPIEEIICLDPQLNNADTRMSQAYFSLSRKIIDTDTKKLFLQDQREWLTKRNAELSICSQPDCEIQFYNLRIKLLHPTADINCNVFETDKLNIKNTDIETNFKSSYLSCQRSINEIICANRLLRHMEGKVIELYTPFKKELNQDQATWIILRDEKLRNCNLACVWQFYKERIEFLIHYSFDES
ncbi:MAG: lysozyme inhibitor LprI family protein [Candidatus Marithrix sp.]